MHHNILFCLALSTTFSMGLGLEAVHVGKLPNKIEGLVAYYDGGDSVILVGGRNFNAPEEPFYDVILQYNLTSGIVEPVGTFPIQVSTGVGSQRFDTGEIYYFGGLAWEGTSTPYENHTVWKLPSTFNLFENITVARDNEADACLTRFTANEWFIIGGIHRNDEMSPAISKFTVNQDTLETVAYLPLAVMGPSAATIDNIVYIFGGDDPNLEAEHVKYITKFTPETNAVEIMDLELDIGVAYSQAITVDEKIYVIGGSKQNLDDPEQHSVSIFVPSEGTIEHVKVNNLPGGLNMAGVFYVPNTNRIYTFGGADGSWITLDDIYYIQLE